MSLLLSGPMLKLPAAGGGATSVYSDAFAYATSARVRDQTNWTNVGNSGATRVNASEQVYHDLDGGFEVLEYNETSGSLNADQYVEMQVVTAPAAVNDNFSLYSRFNSTIDCYYIYCTSSATDIMRDNGTSIWSGAAISDGQTIRIEVSGQTVVYKLDGVDQTAGGVDDTGNGGPTAGTAAFRIGSDGPIIDNFDCGNL